MSRPALVKLRSRQAIASADIKEILAKVEAGEIRFLWVSWTTNDNKLCHWKLGQSRRLETLGLLTDAIQTAYEEYGGR